MTAAVMSVIGAACLGASRLLFAPAGNRVASWEAALFHRVNDAPDACYRGLWPVMQLGNFWAWVAAAAVAGLATRDGGVGVAVASAGLVAWLLAKLVKRAVTRGRPADLLSRAVVRERGIHGHGFVSGHAAVAAAIAGGLTPLLALPFVALAWLLVAVVALARVYAGAHLPLDVLGGAGVGLLCAAAAVALTGI